MSLLEKLKGKARKADIGYGIHEPVVLLSIDDTVRKTKDGNIVNRSFFTKFGKLNKAGVVVAEKEISWFNVDPKSGYAYDNFFQLLDQLVGILDCYFDKDDEDVVAESIDAIFENEEIETVEDLEAAIKDKTQCKSIIEGLSEVYFTLLKDKVGEDSKQIRLKLSYDPKGNYLQQPKYDAFTESMEVDKKDTKLKMSRRDDEYRQKSLVTSTPTAGAPINI
jgi:hypothetical protein